MATECFVVEDSAHKYEATLAALDGFAALDPAGGLHDDRGQLRRRRGDAAAARLAAGHAAGIPTGR